jgi:hypothetical protein
LNWRPRPLLSEAVVCTHPGDSADQDKGHESRFPTMQLVILLDVSSIWSVWRHECELESLIERRTPQRPKGRWCNTGAWKDRALDHAFVREQRPRREIL